MILLYEIGAGKEGEIMLLDLILGAAATIGSVIAAGGQSAANNSDCSDSDRQLGKDIQKSGQNFADIMNRMRDRLNDDD